MITTKEIKETKKIIVEIEITNRFEVDAETGQEAEEIVRGFDPYQTLDNSELLITSLYSEEEQYSGILSQRREVILRREGHTEWTVDVKDHGNSEYIEGYVYNDYTTASKKYESLLELYDYPFNEGDDYWTIEENETTGELEVVWSCWDDESEGFHDENPDQAYYSSEADANTALEEGLKGEELSFTGRHFTVTLTRDIGGWSVDVHNKRTKDCWSTGSFAKYEDATEAYTLAVEKYSF